MVGVMKQLLTDIARVHREHGTGMRCDLSPSAFTTFVAELQAHDLEALARPPSEPGAALELAGVPIFVRDMGDANYAFGYRCGQV